MLTHEFVARYMHTLYYFVMRISHANWLLSKEVIITSVILTIRWIVTQRC